MLETLKEPINAVVDIDFTIASVEDGEIEDACQFQKGDKVKIIAEVGSSMWVIYSEEYQESTVVSKVIVKIGDF
jgi:hypothetical protein